MLSPSYLQINLRTQVLLLIATDFIRVHKTINRIENIFLNDSCWLSSIINLQHHYNLKYVTICVVFIMFNAVLYTVYRQKSEF